MKTHDLIQGSPEWAVHRAQHFNASEEPAMMGCSPYKTRAQLVREAATGIGEEHDAATKRRFDDGHRYEALARPIAEQIIGQDLYPVVGSDGKLSASFDGITMDETLVFEHKSLNNDIRAAFDVPAGEEVFGDRLPLHYRVQMEQQLLVSKAEAALFIASKWEGDKLVEKRVCWYKPDSELRAAIVAGWEQFERDVAAYTPPQAEAPAPVGQAPETLPALRIEISGAVTASNLDAFKTTALAAIRGVNRDLKTDQDFANADKAVKWCTDVEQRLAAAKEHALSQTASIDALFKAIDDISAEARAVRLELDKLVTRRKDEIKAAIILKGRDAFCAHLAELDAEIAPIRLGLPPPDLAAAAKGKRTLQTLQDAVDTALASAKIEADTLARDWRAKLAWYGEEAAGHLFLFADLQALIAKPAEDFRLAVTARIEAHKASEAKKKEDADAAATLAAQAIATAAAPAPARPVFQSVVASIDLPASPAAPAPKANEPATLKLGTICERLGFTMTAAFVADTLGVQHAATDKAAKLYRESQFAEICRALASHIGAMAELYTV